MLGPIVLAILTTGAALASAGGGQGTIAQQSPALPAQATVEKPWPPAGVVRANAAGMVKPRLIKEARPNYTAAAMKAKVTGGVKLEAVVETDGTVGEVRVTRSLDREFGLDEECVSTLKKWQFTPGKKDGVAVPVLIDVEMTFSIGK